MKGEPLRCEEGGWGERLPEVPVIVAAGEDLGGRSRTAPKRPKKTQTSTEELTEETCLMNPEPQTLVSEAQCPYSGSSSNSRAPSTQT